MAAIYGTHAQERQQRKGYLQYLRAFAPCEQIRMALPVTELYALFLERRPEEKERVEQARLLEAKVGGVNFPGGCLRARQTPSWARRVFFADASPK